MSHLLATLCFGLYLSVSSEQPACKSTILDDNITKCIVEERTDLPSFQDEDEFEIVYCSHPVHGTGTELSVLMGFVHSSIGLKQVNGTQIYNFEFWARHFNPQGVLIPAIGNGSFSWNNEGIVTWAPAIHTRIWPHQVSLGFTKGKVLNQFMNWVLEWHTQHQYYQLFSAWDRPELSANTKRYLDDTTCNTFTEDGFAALHRLGATLSSKELLCRTYVVLDADSPLEPVGRFSPENVEMLAYYGTLNTVLHKFKNMSIRKALESIGLAIMERKKPFAFIYDRDGQKYYKATLKHPYLEVWPMYLSQRMVLPWQPVEESRSRECDPWGTSDASTVVV